MLILKVHSLITPAIASYDTIIIKSTLLSKPLHYLIWWGNMDMRWSWWRVISINLNSPSLLYVLLLNLPFCIWMYSVKISEVWNQMLLKNPIYFELMLPCVCSFIESGFSYLNSQCENFWNLETKCVAEKKEKTWFVWAHAFLLLQLLFNITKWYLMEGYLR